MSDKTIRITNPTGATAAHQNHKWRLNVPVDPISEHDVPAELAKEIAQTFTKLHPRLNVDVLDEVTPSDD